MLYVSTRNKTDFFTAYRALHEDRAPDGGMFVPFRVPRFEAVEIEALKEKSFGETVAQILNLFFSARLSGWDVDFCVGRYPVKLEPMRHRIIVAETWHNPESTYSHMVQSLYTKICGNERTRQTPTQWAEIAIHIAVLFGLFAELARMDITEADISVTARDFSSPMAAWYAREMGLPIGTVICGCNENGSAWDLIHRGEFNTNAATVHTHLPELDISCPAGIERLIYGTLGPGESLRYLDVCRMRGVYQLREDVRASLSRGMFAAVVGTNRVASIISSVYHTNNCVIDPFTALSYGSLQDYRSRTGESRYTLLLADRSPLFSSGKIAAAIGISEEEFKKRVNTPKE